MEVPGVRLYASSAVLDGFHGTTGRAMKAARPALHPQRVQLFNLWVAVKELKLPDSRNHFIYHVSGMW